MEENGERKRKAKRQDVRSEKRTYRLGPAIRTKVSSVMRLQEDPRSSRRSCRDTHHKDQLKTSEAVDKNPKKSKSMLSWQWNVNGFKKIETLGSDPECSENDSSNEESEYDDLLKDVKIIGDLPTEVSFESNKN